MVTICSSVNRPFFMTPSFLRGRHSLRLQLVRKSPGRSRWPRGLLSRLARRTSLEGLFVFAAIAALALVAGESALAEVSTNRLVRLAEHLAEALDAITRAGRQVTQERPKQVRHLGRERRRGRGRVPDPRRRSVAAGEAGRFLARAAGRPPR